MEEVLNTLLSNYETILGIGGLVGGGFLIIKKWFINHDQSQKDMMEEHHNAVMEELGRLSANRCQCNCSSPSRD